jgi:hypothetical protein
MLFIVLSVVVILFWILNNKLNNLERRINFLSQSSPRGIGSQVSPDDVSVSPVTPIPSRSASMYGNQYIDNNIQNEKELPNKFIEWIKEDFLVKVGGLLIIIAIGWFVSYAFANNWIGPVGRITLGLLLGVSIMSFGVWRMNHYKEQGGVFTAIGGAIIIMSLFAAREIYDFFTPASALGLMFLTVVFMALASVRYNLQSLAFATLILGSLAPVLTNSPSPDAAGLFSYLMVLTLGTLWVVYQTGWTKFTLASLLVTSLYSLPFLFDSSADQGVVMMFTFTFVGIYFIANLVSLIRRRENSSEHLPTHIVTAIITAVFLFFWIESTAVQEWKSLLYVTWALVFSVGAYLVYVYTANRVAFYLYGAVALGLIGIATAAELDGPALTIAFILEISLLIFVAGRLKATADTMEHLLLLMILPFALSLESLVSSDWRDAVMHGDFAVLLLAFLAFASLGLLVQDYRPEENHQLNGGSRILLSVAGFYGVSLVWLITHAVMVYDTATTVSLIIYTVLGLVFYALGKRAHLSYLQSIGGVLIGGVIFRLLLIDVWGMELEGRIITFLIIGALLISTAFMGKKQKTLTETAE